MQVLSKALKILAMAKNGIWDFFDAFNEDKLHFLDRMDVLQKYVEFKVEDIEEFAAIYTYERHDAMGNLDDRLSKERMYKEVYEILAPLKEKGRLPH